MGYGIAAWVGPQPETKEAAAAEFERLYRRYFTDGKIEPTAPTLVDFLDAVFACYPDLSEDDNDDSPWNEGLLRVREWGTLFYSELANSRAAEVIPFLCALGDKMGVVVFDPQRRMLAAAPPDPAQAPELVATAGIHRERGWLYFLRDRDVMRAPMPVPIALAARRVPEVVWSGSFVCEPGWLYFIDAAGDIRRVRRR
jgi:hypothetical protein